MTHEPVSANRLLVALFAYFAVLLGVVLSAGVVYPDLLPLLPMGGNDVMEIADIDSADESIFDSLDPSENVAAPPATAPEAAGRIHTDFERGFIRAEVMKCEDLFELGSEQAVKSAGKLSVEGKEYVVHDGDIMHFRFNV